MLSFWPDDFLAIWFARAAQASDRKNARRGLASATARPIAPNRPTAPPPNRPASWPAHLQRLPASGATIARAGKTRLLRLD